MDRLMSSKRGSVGQATGAWTGAASRATRSGWAAAARGR